MVFKVSKSKCLIENTKASGENWWIKKSVSLVKIPKALYFSIIFDGKFKELDANLTSKDPLKFEDNKKYTDRLKAAKNKTNLNETAIRGMAAEACLQDENLCQTLENDTISHQAMNILDTSVCSPSGEKEGKSNVVSSIEHAKEDFDTMVQDPDHSEDSEDKDRCKTGEMDISVSENTA